jgi:hypothetical protein
MIFGRDRVTANHNNWQPPKHTRFAPGQCGNPKGRPKKQTDPDMALLNELNDLVLITENSRRKAIPKLEVIIKQLVNKAASGDLKSIKNVHGLLDYWDHPSRRPVCFLVYPEDAIGSKNLRPWSTGASTPKRPDSFIGPLFFPKIISGVGTETANQVAESEHRV